MKRLRMLAAASSCALLIVTGHAGAQSSEVEAKQDAADIVRLSDLLRITVIEEVKAAGFDNPHEGTWSRPRGFLVVAEKKR